jgi:glycogen synthase
MTRVLVVSNMYPPHHYGGYELSCRDVMDRFREHGHDVTVLTTTMRVPGVADPAGERAAGIRRDLEFYWRDHVLLSPSLPRRLAIERHNQRALREALAESRPDVVSVWNMGAMSLGLLTTLARTDVPLVFNVCDDWLDYGPRLDAWLRLFVGRPRLAALVERLTRLPSHLPDLGTAGAYCFVSERTRRFAQERTPWQFERSTVVYSGIDRRDFPPLGKSDGPRPWRWRLLYAGRLDERKGIDTVLRALPLLPDDASLDVLGQGDDDYAAQLRALATELGIGERVRFGSVPRPELRDRYLAADAVVFPSTWNEPFGLVPVESMACATPVVATGRGGSGEFLVDGGNCVLYPSGDHVALAAALERLAGDENLRAHLRVGGLATADELTIDRLAAVLEAWHIAAADRFVSGAPAERTRPGQMTPWSP